jgi:hypothetical protein
MSRIRYERADSLAPHPMLERVGTMISLASHYQVKAKRAGKNRADHAETAAELEGDLAALVESVSVHGILEPIKICRMPDDEPRKLGGPQWWIADGRNRWTAASLAGLKRVPVLRIRTEDAPAVIAATVAGRRHYTKGATAYLGCLLHPEYAMQGRGGDRKSNRTECGLITIETLASKFSVSLRLMEQAAELFRLLEGEGKPFREDAEAAIWSGSGLGGVKAGVDFLIANGKAEPAKPDPQALAAAAAWQSYRRASKAVSDFWGTWDKLEGEQLTVALDGLKDWLAEAPPAARQAIAAALNS